MIWIPAWGIFVQPLAFFMFFAAAIAEQWSALVAAYADGSGKLTALALSDADPLTLTEAQQTEGAALIAALLPDETIVTAA